MRQVISTRVLGGMAVLWMAALLSVTGTLADGPNRQGLYVPPASGFILDPAETPIALAFGSAPLVDIQAQLDAARAGDPDSPIVLTLTGTYTVTNAPLSLPSKMSLVLYGTIKADAKATATSLIAIMGQSKVAVAGGLLDGNNVDLVGIDAENSTQVNIDTVNITNTGQDGLRLIGNGNTVWNSGSAITRCDIAHAGGNGITVGSITQALLLDNFVHGHVGTGIQVRAAHSSIVNNVIQNSGTGIVVDANDNLISDNEIRGNRSGGVRLLSSSANTAVLRNIVAENGGTGIDLDGNNNLVYLNTLNNTIDLTDHAPANWVVPGRARPLVAPNSKYFYPPTIDNRHTSPVMNGRNRTSLTINSADRPAISQVQEAYNDARQQHPDDVIVLTLTGQFTVDAAPLTLQSYTAVILDGAILVPSTSRVGQAITATNPAEFVSISGGTIDLGGRSMEGIFFPSATMAHIDQVTVVRGGQRDVRAGKGMIHFQRGSGYNILHANTVDQSGGRCIWTQQNSSRYVVLENHLTNCNMDAVDFDSSTSNSLAIGNLNEDNRRYGVFIEQSDSANKIYDNLTTTRGILGNPGHGVGVYNNSTTDGQFRNPTQKNTVFSNIGDVIGDSLRVGSIGNSDVRRAETAHNFFFNNTATNTGTGILFDTQGAGSVENYFSQTVLSGNRRDINSHPSLGAAPPDFFNPRSAVNLALNQPATASSSAPDSDPAAAVDGLSFTGWIAGDESGPSPPWLTVDLGADASFLRVVLKQTEAVAIRRIKLQTSEDGVSFTDIPGTAKRLGRARNLTFAPVTARFLRVQVQRSTGGPVGLEEVAVYAE